MRIGLPACLLIVACSSSVIFPQRKRAPLKTPPAPFVFALEADKVPPHFKGSNIKSVYSELLAREKRAEKGEFETTEEFKARVQREQTRPVSLAINLESPIVFRIENFSGETFYDADAKLMTIAIVLSGSAKSLSGVPANKALSCGGDMKRDSYEGSNAYGAKAIISRLTGHDYKIGFPNYKSFRPVQYESRGRTGRDAILIQIPMAPVRAKATKERLAVLAVVRLRPPYVYDDSFYKKPTINDPNEMFIRYYLLNCELLELWVFDELTGEVLRKKKSSEP